MPHRFLRDEPDDHSGAVMIGVMVAGRLASLSLLALILWRVW